MFFQKKVYPYGKQSISWSDIWEVVKVLRSPWITQGPKIKEFEEALCSYTGARYAVVVTNATAALHLAMLALELKKDDEIITSPMTFVASANCVLYAGGKVQFADIDAVTACIDVKEIEKKITAQTRGIIPVHFSGIACDMDAIHVLAKKYNLFVVDDAAHAIGSEYKGKKIGNGMMSDMTIFSFHPVKTIATGEGGAITTNNKELYQRLMMLRTHGITKEASLLSKDEGAWYYEMQHLGFNYRMTDMQAALGVAQLKRLDQFVCRRREIVTMYQQAFQGDMRFDFLHEPVYSKAAFHLFPLLINIEKMSMNKKQIFDALKTKGILAQVHYIPVHLQPFYQQQGFREGDYPCAERYYKKALSLPLYPSLTYRDVEKIITAVKEVVR